MSITRESFEGLPEPAPRRQPVLERTGAVADVPTVRVPAHSTRRHGSWRAKRVLDLACALLLVVLLAPLMLSLAGAIRCTSRGPVIFRQRRIGRGGAQFVMLKFRSMTQDAEAVRASLGDLNQADGPLFKVRADPRVTALGRWMRRNSLDELPQLFNVIGGSMSMVGPRPALPEEVSAYSAEEQRRLWAKPGLTGLWQVSGRSDLGWREGIELDLRYVETWSLAMDLRILAMTLPAVVLAKGAY